MGSSNAVVHPDDRIAIEPASVRTTTIANATASPRPDRTIHVRFRGRGFALRGRGGGFAKWGHARENTRDRSYAPCLTAKPLMHHRRVLMWLWRLVAAG